MKTKILKPTDDNIEVCAEIIKNGGLVAFPTETVYGLGANALDDEAVKSIYLAKGRPSDNPLIVHIGKKEDFENLVSVFPEKAKKLVDEFFPAPLTIILPKSDKVGNTVSGGLNTVAVRMPNNETARKLILASGVPVAAPSANTSGRPSPTKASHVIDDMNSKIDAILDGEDCEFGVESTVITLAGDVPIILRPGAITKKMIEKIIGHVEVAQAVTQGMEKDEIAVSPGMKYKHYSPKARVVIVKGSKEQYETFVNSKTNSFALCFEKDNVTIPKVTFGLETDDLSQARTLFSALRKLDKMGAKKVYARIPNKSGVGMAVYNRLIRAAAFQIIDLEKPFLIGLTGPTGAGKGFVGEILEKMGFKVFDTDFYSRKVIEKNSKTLTELKNAFGDDIIKDGKLNRKKLAEIAFSSKENTKVLNRITHPAIISLAENDAKGEMYSVLDAPLLFESKAHLKCYKTITVIANEELRIKRIMERDLIDEKMAKLRINAQKSANYYMSNSDFTIYNNGENLENQIKIIMEEIL